jgi:hypothetical protein
VEKKFKVQSFNQLAKSHLGGQWNGVDDYMRQLSAPLAKALATSGVPGYSDGTALVLQNLDSIMSSVLFDRNQLVKQRWIERVASINPIFQWNRRNTYGSSRGAMGFAEGNIGPVGLSSWARNTEPVRFFGVQRGTTVIANIAGALGGLFNDPVEEEEYDGTMQLLGNVERTLIWGNSTIKDANGNDIFYDGAYRKLKARAGTGKVFPKNIIDLHGKPMNFDVISMIAAELAKVYVTSSQNVAAFMPPDALQTLQLLKTQSERRDLSDNRDGGYAAGTPIGGYNTQIGNIPFIQDVFTEPVDGGKAPLATADGGAPTAVITVTLAAASPSGSQVSNWLASDAGTVYYTIGAFNASGEAVGYLKTSGLAVTAGQIATVTITSVSGAIGYRVYRGVLSSGADAQWIGEVSASGAGTVAFVDDNSIMPGCDVASFFERSPENLVIAQMAPLLKLPLAIQSTTIPFGLLYLHTLAMKVPERQFMVVNIGKTNYTA